jgi:hypothetical protein
VKGGEVEEGGGEVLVQESDGGEVAGEEVSTEGEEVQQTIYAVRKGGGEARKNVAPRRTRGRGRKNLPPVDPRHIRTVFLKFAAAFSRAETNSQLIDVMAQIDYYVDEVLSPPNV